MRAAGWDGDIVAYLVKDWCFQGAAKSNPAYFVNRVAEALTAALGSTWKTENCEGSKKVIRAVGSNKQEQTIATPTYKATSVPKFSIAKKIRAKFPASSAVTSGVWQSVLKFVELVGRYCAEPVNLVSSHKPVNSRSGTALLG